MLVNKKINMYEFYIIKKKCYWLNFKIINILKSNLISKYLQVELNTLSEQILKLKHVIGNSGKF